MRSTSVLLFFNWNFKQASVASKEASPITKIVLVYVAEILKGADEEGVAVSVPKVKVYLEVWGKISRNE